MTLNDIMADCPSLEDFLRIKEGQFARMIERALIKMVDDVHDANKQPDGKRSVKVTIFAQPEADRSTIRILMDDPTLTEAKSKAPAVAQMHIVETANGPQLRASESSLNQDTIHQAEARGHGLHTEEIS